MLLALHLRKLKVKTIIIMKESLNNVTAQVFIIVGKKEQLKMITSAKKLNAIIPNSSLLIREGFYHRDFSINHAQEYVNFIMEVIQG